MNVEIAQRLAARRKQAGLSQEALAEQLSVSRQAVSKWERSESSPDTDNLIALAQLYGVSLDELLYVDDEARDDMAFAAVDRAEGGAAGQESGQPVGQTNASVSTLPSGQTPEPDFESDASFSEDSAETSSEDKAEADPTAVLIGLGGIHVLDGEDYVHVSWRDGVHVKDSESGDEVHVGWGGVHIQEGAASDPAAKGKSSEGSPAADGSPAVKAAAEGERFCADHRGVVINGEHFDTWQEARDQYGYWSKGSEPCGYSVCGERFDNLDDARAKYGPEVGKTIPVRKHYAKTFESAWMKFPYPLFVFIVYLLLGVLNGAWAMGLFLFFTVPLYYLIGHAVAERRLGQLVAGAYPLGVTAWFLYMAFVLNQPHPAWIAFLTIPLVEWLVHSLSRWWSARKRAKVSKEQRPVDVDAE